MAIYHRSIPTDSIVFPFTVKDRTPFFYILTHIETGKRYAGSKTSKGCHPSQLWSTYFSSSKIIRRIVEAEGPEAFMAEVRHLFSSVAECLNFEAKFLKKIQARTNPNWFNLHEGDACWSTAGKTLGPYSSAHRHNISEALLGKAKSFAHCKAISESHMGHVPSAEHLKNQSLAFQKLKWVNNGTLEQRISKDEIPIYLQKDFILGRIKGQARPTLKGVKLSTEHKKNIRAGLLGHKTSEETKKLISRKNKNAPKDHLCPHCNRFFVKGHFNQWHGDKCKMA